MLVIIGALALLAVFANVQRFRRGSGSSVTERRGDVETVVVRPPISPTPKS